MSEPQVPLAAFEDLLEVAEDMRSYVHDDGLARARKVREEAGTPCREDEDR